MSKKSKVELRTSAQLARPHTALSPRVAGVNAVAAAVAGILYCAAVTSTAQAQVAEAPTSDTSGLDEIVVTASAQSVKKLDASYNIVSVSLDDIKNANPLSTAEIYKLSPGIWPESSGGQTGANIDVAGFPNGGGDSPYVTTMIQGSPLYGSPYLSFMDNSSLVRMDDTVERVELVQGGTGAIFGPGQPGLTTNFILRTGSDKPEGSIGFTYGFEGSERVDAFLSGKIIDGWYGSLGGFYRSSDGVRNPQYTADIGGQLTATLKHDLDNGSIMFWARGLQDKNLWVADFPYSVSNGNISPYPGFNQLNSTYNSKQLQNFQIPSPSGGFWNDDIGNGRGAAMNFVGSELKLKFANGWSLSNNFLFDGGYMNTSALVNSSGISTLSSYLASLSSLTTAGISPTSVQATYANGATVSPNQNVLTESVWFVQKKITNVTDEFRIAKAFDNGNTLTGGVYVAHYTDNDAWALGANVLIDNAPNASPIILQAVQGGNIFNVTSSQGIVNANNGYDILEQGKATNVAFYLSDSWKISNWLVDASARLERIDLTQQTTNQTNKQLGTKYDLWDNAVSLPNGTYSHEGEINTVPTFSLGANYEFNDHMSAYVRVNSGIHFDNFDDVRCNVNNGTNGCGGNPPLQRMQNYEGGFKIQNRYTYVDASIYQKEFSGIPYQPENSQSVPIGPKTEYGSLSRGVRLVSSVNPFAFSDMQPVADFKIKVNADYEDAHYKDFKGCYIYENIQGTTVCGTIEGQPLARLPSLHFLVTPEDTQVFSWGTLTEFMTYEHVGQHYQDGTGLNPLGTYYDIGAGVTANIGDNWQVRLLGSNLTDQIGLTEGNARFGGNAVVNEVGFGRSIVGREINIGAKYKF